MAFSRDCDVPTVTDMPMFRSRRTTDEADARAARARLAALGAARRRPAPSTPTSTPAPRQGARTGWTPRVPTSAPRPPEDPHEAWQGVRTSSENARLDAAVDRFWHLDGANSAHRESEGWRAPDRPGRHRARDGANIEPNAVDHEPADHDQGPREHDHDRSNLAARFGIGRTHLVAIVLAIVAALVVTGVSALAARPDTEPVSVDVAATGTPMPEDGATTSTGDLNGEPDGESDGESDGGGEVVVHVAGKVEDPGVVTLPSGSRVIDAIDAVGGVRDEVDLSPLNLARVLGDGEQVLVGIEPPPGAAPEGSADSGGASNSSGAGGAVDLNTATGDELEQLPGIGPALAQRILDWRMEHGRFTTIDELREVSGIGEQTMADLEPLVTV